MSALDARGHELQWAAPDEPVVVELGPGEGPVDDGGDDGLPVGPEPDVLLVQQGVLPGPVVDEDGVAALEAGGAPLHPRGDVGPVGAVRADDEGVRPAARRQEEPAGQRGVLVGAARDRLFDEQVPRDARHRREHRFVGDARGTQALHQSKESARLRTVSSFLNGFAKTARRDLVRPLWILNGFDPTSPADPQNLPTLEWNALEFADGGAVVQSVSALLTAAGVEHTIEWYPALHGFAVPDNAPYDEAAAEKHWDAMKDFFGAHLAG